jgi:hypothetical protein
MLLKMHQADAETIKQLRAQLSGIKAAGSHSRAGDAAPPPSATPPTTTAALLKESTEEAMGRLFNTPGATP